MSKFVLVYHGGNPPETDEEKDQVMAASGYKSWMGRADNRRAISAAVFGCLMAIVMLATIPATSANAAGKVRFESSKGKVRIQLGPQKVVAALKPFRITVFSPGGKKLFSTLDRSFQAGGVRYSGLGFSVGADPELTPPTLTGSEPDPVATVEPTRYTATRILSISKARGSVELVLATDDPDGRTIPVRIFRTKSGLLKFKARVDRPERVSAISAGFNALTREAFHGFGGRRESTDLRGVDLKSWVLDYRYPDASTGWYSPYPGFISSRGYGFLLGGSRISRWRMASDRSGAWRVSKAGSSVSITISSGGPAKSIKGLTSVTGRHRLPPDWSTGPMLSRTIGILTDHGDVYRNKVEADVDRILQGDLPVSSYGFEGWAGLPRDFVVAQIYRLKSAGIKSFLYLRPFVSNDIAGTEQPGAFDEAISRGLVATDSNGDPYLFPSPFPGAQAALIDFTDPAAVKWWRSRVFDLLSTGALGFMNDFGEQVEEGMNFADGTPVSAMHNRYPALQAKVTREAVSAWEKKNPGPNVFFFQRAGFTGTPGSAAYENGQFPGDETVDWQRGTGLPSIVPDMLNRAVTGSPGFTVDIGGYAQFTKESPILPPTSAELFTRWSEAAALMPFFRVHNSGLNGARMPWDFDEATLDRWKSMAELHNRARPLTRRLWKNFVKTGIPMNRPLWLVDPGRARTPHVDDEWLLGNNLLVAPVMEEGATSRTLRLPTGCWKLHGRGAGLRSRDITVDAPLGVLPWFTRCGTSPL